MPVSDKDALVRDLAYSLWEEAGRPSGREHEHWAEARRRIEVETGTAKAADIRLDADRPDATGSEPVEAARLRRALYAPEPFSFELFGSECPRTERTIVLRGQAKPARSPSPQNRTAA